MNPRPWLVAAASIVLSLPSFAAGRQLTGQHAPATTPALKPAEAQKKFTVPDGFEVRLFAAEPDVINPVAMTWDDRGRLWVVELYEYPLGAPSGTKPRDRIKILEDTDNDGKADKVTVFADGLNLATGILLGNGGAYVGQAPDLLFLEDTNGDDVADKRTVLMTGFGLEDRHELLNGFTWGPDGYLYMTHGVFTFSKVKSPDAPASSGVTMNAAVARFQPKSKRFEVFADGTSNPWGVDFDREGNAFVSACVIDHLFHMAPGGVYVRQAGSPANPYAYTQLPSIVDHKHFMAAYAGVQVYQGDQYPEEYRGTILMGNIHDSALHQDRLTPSGASFKATFMKDFLRANDGWFRPVSTQVGPDGAAWVMDWYDKYPCYQNANADPEGVDREHGRIWRVVYTGKDSGRSVPSHPAGLNLGKASTTELVQTLAHRNVWQRRMAQRILTERADTSAREPLLQLLRNGKDLESRLAALWTLHTTGLLADSVLDQTAADPDPVIRAWTARLTGERPSNASQGVSRLESLASDKDARVRFSVAVAVRQFTSGSLTIDTPPRASDADVNPVMANLVKASANNADPLVTFMIWMAAEPAVVEDPTLGLGWLAENGMDTQPLSSVLLTKVARRLCDAQKPEMIDHVLNFINALPASASPLVVAALDGLIEGQRGKAILPSKPTGEFLARLTASNNNDVRQKAQQLGSLWGDSKAIADQLAKLNDPKAPDTDRIQSLAAARKIRNETARAAVMKAIEGRNSDSLKVEAVRALAEIGGDRVGEFLVGGWRGYSATLRRAVADTLVSRTRWLGNLLSAIEQREISSGDLPATVIRSLLQSKDEEVRNRASVAIGRVREANPDKLGLIAAKRRVVLAAEPDLAAGREIARKTCFVCHKLHGEGAEVGPDLTGVGRSTLDALLANIIDPNQIIGKGYENVEVETKDGRVVSGRLVEDTNVRVRLLAAGPKEEVIARSDIAHLRVSELSVMPEGLEQMPDADFRNLIWYLLNPPQDKRPMTPELRRELIGDEKPRAQLSTDGESVALWNPLWEVKAAPFADTPRKLIEYAGKHSVLVTHPIDRGTPVALERTVSFAASARPRLKVALNAEENGEWEFRIRVNGTLMKQRVIGHDSSSWSEVQLDLSEFAGQTVTVRLEHSGNDWPRESAYWGGIELSDAPELRKTASR